MSRLSGRGTSPRPAASGGAIQFFVLAARSATCAKTPWSCLPSSWNQTQQRPTPTLPPNSPSSPSFPPFFSFQERQASFLPPEVMLAPVAATMALTRVVVRAAVPISAAEVVAAKAEAPRAFPARAQRGPTAPFQPVQKPQVAPRHVAIEADLPGQTCRCPRTKIGAMGTARRSRTIRSTSPRTNAMLGATRGTDRSPQTITKTVFGCGRKQ